MLYCHDVKGLMMPGCHDVHLIGGNLLLLEASPVEDLHLLDKRRLARVARAEEQELVGLLLHGLVPVELLLYLPVHHSLLPLLGTLGARHLAAAGGAE